MNSPELESFSLPRSTFSPKEPGLDRPSKGRHSDAEAERGPMLNARLAHFNTVRKGLGLPRCESETAREQFAGTLSGKAVEDFVVSIVLWGDCSPREDNVGMVNEIAVIGVFVVNTLEKVQ